MQLTEDWVDTYSSLSFGWNGRNGVVQGQHFRPSSSPSLPNQGMLARRSTWIEDACCGPVVVYYRAAPAGALPLEFILYI